MPPDTSKHDFEIMLQNFLLEQFKIKLHHEPKLFPAYDLVVVPGGPKLTPSDPDAPDTSLMMMGMPKIDSGGFIVPPPGHGVVAVSDKGLHQTFQQFTMSEFADNLISDVTPQGAPTHYVLDKTGITGKFDFKLKFEEDGQAIQLGPNVQAALPAPDPLGPGSGLPNIFKAIEQQLGLKLVKAKEIPMDTIVIDHAERIPAGN
jgi:uncharacterized protein (TIGR03435 family)